MSFGGGGGHVSLGPVHHPRQSLSEEHPKRGWSDGTHSSLNTTPHVRTGISLPDFLPFPRTCLGRSVNLIPFLHIFLFSIPLTLYARYAPGGEKDTLFYTFLLTRMLSRPQWDMPPPPPPPPECHYKVCIKKLIVHMNAKECLQIMLFKHVLKHY